MTNRTQAPNNNVPLQTPPSDTPPPPEAKAAHYSASFLVETSDGVQCEITGHELRPADLMAFIQKTSAGIISAGLKPMPRQVIINLGNVGKIEDEAPARGQGGRGGGYRGEVYTECPSCGAGVYDNRQKKANNKSWRGPFFKCKNDCGFLVFKSDGTPND